MSDKPTTADGYPPELAAEAVGMCLYVATILAGAIHTPSDPGWHDAKFQVQVADIIHHEMIAHLGRTHLAIEPFLIAAFRNLAPSHPLFELLAPHFRFTAAINDLATYTLVNKDGIVDHLLSPLLTEDLKLAGAAAQESFATRSLAADLAARGVANEADLPDYPYRDDARLLAAAITDFVTEYVAIYYKTDDDVKNDTELHGFLAEAATAGRIPGIPVVADVHALVAFLAQLIFTAGPHHAAVNYPQYTFLSSPLIGPWASFAAAPAFETPSIALAWQQQFITYVLTAFYPDKLGDYPVGSFTDPGAAVAAHDFSAALATIEAKITARNAGLPAYRRYEFLLPSRIPNGTSI